MDLNNFISVKSELNWDEYFMLQAMMASFKSKDPSTKVGCVIVDENNHQISMGYNGMVAGVDETKIPWGNDKSVSISQQKYPYVVHAEANAICHAKSDLESSKIYVTLFPCSECTKLMATKKIKEVVYLSNKYKFSADNNAATHLMDLCGITHRQFVPSPDLIEKINKYLVSIITP